MLLPVASFEDATKEVRRYVESNHVPVCLASCKLFRGVQSLLRFDGSGICLALDFPRDQATVFLEQFLADGPRASEDVWQAVEQAGRVCRELSPTQPANINGVSGIVVSNLRRG